VGPPPWLLPTGYEPVVAFGDKLVRHKVQPCEYGTYKTDTARFWPGLSGKSRSNLFSYFLFARKRVGDKLVWHKVTPTPSPVGFGLVVRGLGLAVQGFRVKGSRRQGIGFG